VPWCLQEEAALIESRGGSAFVRYPHDLAHAHLFANRERTNGCRRGQDHFNGATAFEPCWRE
jgi:hypothetical protein